MEDDILKLIKKNYEARKERKQEIFDLLQRIKKLGENETVKKYLELIEQLESVDYIGIMNRSNVDMMNGAFRSHMHLINQTNEIYLCMGSYMLEDICDIEHGPKSIRLSDEDPRVEYKIYMDIEQECGINVPINMCKEFEAIHKVIFTDKLYTGKVYHDVQREFISLAMEEGQEKACEKVLKAKW